MSEAIQKPLRGRQVFLMFLAFFGVIVTVNMIFMTYALKTHSGVVTDKPYEKGLAHDAYLAKAQSQPKWNTGFTFENNILRVSLKNEENEPLNSANVNVYFMRPIKSGDDFTMQMRYVGGGIYEIAPEFPHIGAWNIKLDTKWNGKQYQNSHNLIVK